MGDLIWFLVISVLFALLGYIFMRLGWQIWKKQRMDLIIRSHCEKVREENKQAYCARFGAGILIMGIGFLISGICTAFMQSAFALIPMTAGLVTGIVLLIGAIAKYNR